MKAALWVSTLLLAVSSASLAQRLPGHTAVVSNQSQTDDAAARVERQRRYDPQAGVPTIRPGIFENSLKSINRQNLDYGAQLAKWRQVMVESTIQSVTYWTAIALAGGVLLACTYILCLLRERDRRLEITTNIVTQIINWYYYTRSHAVDAIERHNTLIEEYNTVAEQLATLRTQRRGSEILEALLRTEAAGIPLSEPDMEEAAHEHNAQSRASNVREHNDSFVSGADHLASDRTPGANRIVDGESPCGDHGAVGANSGASSERFTHAGCRTGQCALAKEQQPARPAQRSA